MDSRIIETLEDVAEGAAWLAMRDPRLADALARTGPLPLRRRAGGFEALLNAIVGQQISVAAANGIWSRLESAGATDQARLREMDDTALQKCGLSRPKVRYARALAESEFDFDSLTELSDADVIQQLVALKGIGVWTAEIYAMFSLGRPDVFAAGDLALQEAARVLFELDSRPTEKELRQRAEAWSPWRAVAARLLWAYYRVAKDREGIR